MGNVPERIERLVAHEADRGRMRTHGGRLPGGGRYGRCGTKPRRLHKRLYKSTSYTVLWRFGTRVGEWNVIMCRLFSSLVFRLCRPEIFS